MKRLNAWVAAGLIVTVAQLTGCGKKESIYKLIPPADVTEIDEFNALVAAPAVGIIAVNDFQAVVDLVVVVVADDGIACRVKFERCVLPNKACLGTHIVVNDGDAVLGVGRELLTGLRATM